MYSYELDFMTFDKVGVDWEIALEWPNGASFKFLKCNLYYKYKTSNVPSLEICADKVEDIEFCIGVLSYLTQVPLVMISREIVEKDSGFQCGNRQLDKMKHRISRLYTVDEVIKNYEEKGGALLKELVNSLASFSSGLRHKYVGLNEEAFLMFFRIVENISNQVVKNHGIFSKRHKENDKERIKKFLAQFCKDKMDVDFDENKLKAWGDEVYKQLRNLLNNNHSNILYAWKNLNNTNEENLTSEELTDLVNIRNGIAHGREVKLLESDVLKIMEISYEMLSLYYFDTEYKNIRIWSKQTRGKFYSDKLN
jgi:hypothetical protein